MSHVAEKDTQSPPPAVTCVSSKPNSRNRRSSEAASDLCLEVSPTAFSDETLRGLIDEWLIQALVNRYIHERLEAAQQEHSEKQPSL
jgi:hypothetical protein